MYAEHKDIPAALVYLDNEKAFDRVERNSSIKPCLNIIFQLIVLDGLIK